MSTLIMRFVKKFPKKINLYRGILGKRDIIGSRKDVWGAIFLIVMRF